MENVEIILPEEYVNRMQIQLGDKFDLYKKSLNQPAVRGIRVNTKRISVADFKKIFNYQLVKLEYIDNGFKFDSEEKIGNSFEHLSGLFYLQEPSSMIPVCASDICNDLNRDLKILDLCASPGGKTGQIASILSNNSIIFSNEIVSSRVGALYSNVERQGFENVIILNEKPERLENFEGYFDYVFVDAPCSGEGMFRKNPQTINEWSTENVFMCSVRQKQILAKAIKLVKNGGKLVYSTCTFNKEEDEDIVMWLLGQNFELIDIPESIKNVTASSNLMPPYNDFARKFYPFTGEGEGQFVAVFKNNNDNQCNNYLKKYNKSIFKLGKSEYKIVKDWALNTFELKFANELLNKNIVMVGDNIFVLPNSILEKEISILDDLKFEALGIKLGKLQKGRFEMDHAAVMAYYKYFKLKIELSQSDALKFLHGEQLEFNDIGKSYGVITFNGYPLGGIRLVDKKLKNLLPKGLRI